ncbi:MAG: hypothetical protein ACRDYU_20070, partial [Actinomycetes bacterium]
MRHVLVRGLVVTALGGALLVGQVGPAAAAGLLPEPASDGPGGALVDSVGAQASRGLDGAVGSAADGLSEP